jgi:hypothetical protein
MDCTLSIETTQPSCIHVTCMNRETQPITSHMNQTCFPNQIHNLFLPNSRPFKFWRAQLNLLHLPPRRDAVQPATRKQGLVKSSWAWPPSQSNDEGLTWTHTLCTRGHARVALLEGADQWQSRTTQGQVDMKEAGFMVFYHPRPSLVVISPDDARFTRVKLSLVVF